MSERKKPRCRSCGRPMAGHRRESRKLVCTIPSPPSTPSGYHPRSRDVSPMRQASPLPDIELPDTGYMHRVNPNWDLHGDFRLLHNKHVGAPEGSAITPTELNSEDRQSVKGFRNGIVRKTSGHSDSISVYSSASLSSEVFIESILKTSEPLASLFKVPRSDATRIANGARKHGLSVGILRHPAYIYGGTGNDDTVYMVLGKSNEGVQHLVTLDKMVMPGTLSVEESEWPRLGFLQIMFAGAMGGLVVYFLFVFV